MTDALVERLLELGVTNIVKDEVPSSTILRALSGQTLASVFFPLESECVMTDVLANSRICS